MHHANLQPTHWMHYNALRASMMLHKTMKVDRSETTSGRHACSSEMPAFTAHLHQSSAGCIADVLFVGRKLT